MDFSFLKRLKNLEIKKSYVVLAVIIALIIRFWGESTVTMLQREVPIINTTEISQEEIERYIQTKQQYFDDGISIDPNIIVSRDLESYLDNDVHEWFLLRGWRPKRFFYVEERIRKIVDFIHNRNARILEANELEERATISARTENQRRFKAGLTVAQLRKQANTIKYNLNREIRHAGINEDEDNAVTRNLSTIETLLER